MTRKEIGKERLRFFLLGILSAVAIILFISAAYESTSSLITAGRYRLGTWGMTTGGGWGSYGAFAIDTSTGETKIVYKALYSGSRERIKINQLGKPFYVGEPVTPKQRKKSPIR